MRTLPTSLLMTLTLALLAACPAPDSPAPDSPAPDSPADKPAPDKPIVDDIRETPVKLDPAKVGLADPKVLSDRWLVILDSEGNVERRTDRLSKLAALSAIKSAPARLSSTEFKGLMPCYDVLIANSFAKKEEAISYSKQLTALGVGNYPKHAGKYVGKQPAVDAYCNQEKKPGTCGKELSLVVSHRDRTFVHQNLTPLVKSRAVAGLPSLREIDVGVWMAPMDILKLSGTALEDPYVVVDSASKSKKCKVDRFVVLVRGTPHFSMTKSKQPVCGVPEVFAEVDCKVADPVLAYKAAAKVVVAKPSKPQPAGAVADAFKKDAFTAAQKDGAAHAQEQGAKLQEEATLTNFRAGGTTWGRTELRLFTGEGNSECGGPDYEATVVGWGKKAGAGYTPLGKTQAANARTTRLVFDKEGTTYEVFTELFGDLGIQAVGGEELCRLSKPFCDCGC